MKPIQKQSDGVTNMRLSSVHKLPDGYYHIEYDAELGDTPCTVIFPKVLLSQGKNDGDIKVVMCNTCITFNAPLQGELLPDDNGASLYIQKLGETVKQPANVEEDWREQYARYKEKEG